MIGTNDLAVGITPEEVAANVEKLLDRFAEESPWTKIYVQSILPVNGVDTKAKPKNHWKRAPSSSRPTSCSKRFAKGART